MPAERIDLREARELLRQVAMLESAVSEWPMNFRIRKGTHVSHFHERCPRWPQDNFYEQEKPLWWGNLCGECAKLADIDAANQSRTDLSRKAGTGC